MRARKYYVLGSGSNWIESYMSGSTAAAQDFPVVCVGGSAGGLDAYIRLLRNLPVDMGLAIVIVNHLRKVATRLPEILPDHTKMPVELITEKLLIEPDRVFIIPENRDLHLVEGAFHLKPISKPLGWPERKHSRPEWATTFSDDRSLIRPMSAPRSIGNWTAAATDAAEDHVAVAGGVH